MALCSIMACEKKAIARGWCANHYSLWRRYGDPYIKHSRWDDHTKVNKMCALIDCGKPSGKANYCSMHRQRKMRHDDMSVVLPHHRVHHFNEQFLDTWTKESAYFLGWMLTDGNVDKDMCNASIVQKEKEPLDMLRKLLGHPQEPRWDGTKLWYIRFHSKYLVARLIELGIVPRKSLIVQLPSVPKDVLSHFVRGVVEGDGSLTPPKYLFRITINSASIVFLTQLQEALSFTGSLFEIGKGKRKNSMYRLVYSGKQAKALGDWMYNDSVAMRLPRKYDRYTAVCSA